MNEEREGVEEVVTARKIQGVRGKDPQREIMLVFTVVPS